jgi:hypothetical protein
MGAGIGQEFALFSGPAVDLNLDIRRFIRKNAIELIVLPASVGGFYRPNALICDGIRVLSPKLLGRFRENQRPTFRQQEFSWAESIRGSVLASCERAAYGRRTKYLAPSLLAPD